MFKEFKEFTIRGNVLDLAVAVIIGAAFGTIITSLVNDVLMPPIGLVLGRVNFSNLFVALSATSYPTLDDAKKAGVPILAYGSFVQSVVDFTIIAFAIFLVVKQVNRFRKTAPPPEPSAQERLLAEIRDLLKGSRA